MKILHTAEFYYPSVGGVQEVVRQLSERLVCRGNEVTVATSRLQERTFDQFHGVKIVQFSVAGNLVNGFSGDIQAYRDFVVHGEYDVITCFAAQQWSSDALLPVLDQIKAIKIFVPTGFSALFNTAYQDYFAKMPEWLGRFDMNVFLSEQYQDVDFARRHGIEKIMVIPNGAGEDEFFEVQPDIRARLGIPVDHFLVLHVGSHTGLKGHDRAMEIFKVSDISNTVLLIVGNEPQGGCGSLCRQMAKQLNSHRSMQMLGKRILVTSLSRSDTVAAYQTADLFLFPSLVECSPIVLFECMASHTPFLTSAAGNSAEIIQWSGGAGVLLPSNKPSWLQRLWKRVQGRRTPGDEFDAIFTDIAGSASVLMALYKDKGRREVMARAGFDAWQQQFTWEKIATIYESLYRSLTAGKRL